MKPKFNLFLVFLLCLTLIGCPNNDDAPDSMITIKNNSELTVIEYYELNNINDTLLENLNYPLNLSNTTSRIIYPNGTKFEKEQFIKVLKDNPQKVLMLFLFDKEVIAEVPWEQITNEYLVLKRYDLSLADLNELEWIVNYN